MHAAWHGCRLATWAWRAAGVVVCISLAAVIAYSLETLPVRPLDGVEGEVLYEAQRIRSSLPLYVDPTMGAFDHGPVPSRFFVLYPPVWSGLLSLVPNGLAASVARAAACCSWFGILFLIALRAPAERRRSALVAAAFVGGVFTLALFGSAGRPDAIALLLSGMALLRAVERKKLDAGCGALFALAAWVKPNVLGIAVGAMLAGTVEDRRAGLRAIIGAAIVSSVLALEIHLASHGAWIDHLTRSTGQPPSISVWCEQALWRLQFLGLPACFALASGRSSRAQPDARIAWASLATSLAWTMVSLSKIGAASNYWMEPALAGVVVIARSGPLSPKTPAASLGLATLALLQSLWTGVASIRSSAEAMASAHTHRALVDRARRDCGAASGDVVLADEPGLELMLNGRIVATPFQVTHLARAGRLSTSPWVSDVNRPQIRCLLTEDDLLERPLADVRVEHDRFGPDLREALRRRFVLVEQDAGWHLYRAKGQSVLP